MTHRRHTARQARIRRVSDGVVASYIHDISTDRRRPHGPVTTLRSTAGVGNGTCTVTPPSITGAWPVT